MNFYDYRQAPRKRVNIATFTRPHIFDDFTGPNSLDQRWTRTSVGSASLTLEASILHMALGTTPQGTYADAQIDDYHHLARSDFPWRPPLYMEVRARSSLPAATPASTSTTSGILRGTAGFGFWNYPFSIQGDILMLPEAIWFFYASPPSNMALVPGIPGWGWKAQVVHSMRRAALGAVVPTALATGWGLLTGNSTAAGRWLQRLSGANETLLEADLHSWHTYALEWHNTQARFLVDNIPVLNVAHPPTRPLGFVAWLDNQYAVATPRGSLRFGTVGIEQEEWFALDSIRIEPF